jgi:hypothetical protein
LKTELLLNLPWRNGLIATTGLSLFAFFASILWGAGHADWAFVVAFIGLWLLISLIWSSDHFNEESSTVLASIMDHNFEQMHERLEQLEQVLESSGSEPQSATKKAA